MALSIGSITAYLSFDGDSVIDNTGLNTFSTSGSLSYVDGKVRRAAQFGGTQYIYKSISDIHDAVASYSQTLLFISAWVKPSSVTTSYHIVSRWAASPTTDRVYALVLHTPDGGSTYRFMFYVSDGTNYHYALSTVALSADTYYFVAAWYNSDADKIYIKVNNETTQEQAYTYGFSTSSLVEFVVGASATEHAYKFSGELDDVMIARCVPSSDDLTFLYNSGNGRNWQEIVGYCNYYPLTLGRIRGHWSFENNYLDDSIYGNNLTAVGTPTFPAGKIGSYAVDFEYSDATKPYAWIADNTSLSFGGGAPLLVSVWVKPESNPALAHDIVNKWKTGGLEFALIDLYTGSKLVPAFYVSWDGASSVSVAGPVGMTLGTWNHIVAWFDPIAHVLACVLNGGAPTFNYVPGNIYDSSTKFVVGARDGVTTYTMDGSIDNLLVAGATPTTAQIAWLYNGGSGRSWGDIQAAFNHKPSLVTMS